MRNLEGIVMTPDASTWRSSAEYDHLDALTASDLAWEWLRRNEAYDADFDTLAASDAPVGMSDKNRQRWGLRFHRRSTDSSA